MAYVVHGRLLMGYLVRGRPPTGHVMRGRPLDRDAVALELGDALWCLAVAADTLGISLNDIARRNLEKLRSRYPD